MIGEFWILNNKAEPISLIQMSSQRVNPLFFGDSCISLFLNTLKYLLLWRTDRE